MSEERGGALEGRIRLMLVDDHASFRDPLAFMLALEPDLAVVAQAGSVSDARAALDAGLQLDVAVVDLDLPDGFGAQLVSHLRRERPRAPALVLSAHSQPGRLAAAIDAGAAGVLHKSARLPEIVGAIRDLHAGERLLSPREISQAARLAGRAREEDREALRLIGKLTPRELDVLRALAEGLSDREISEKLYVGVGTVRTHLTNVLAKLEVRSRLQALVFAMRHGLVDMDQPGDGD